MKRYLLLCDMWSVVFPSFLLPSPPPVFLHHSYHLSSYLLFSLFFFYFSVHFLPDMLSFSYCVLILTWGVIQTSSFVIFLVPNLRAFKYLRHVYMKDEEGANRFTRHCTHGLYFVVMLWLVCWPGNRNSVHYGSGTCRKREKAGNEKRTRQE